MHGPPWPIGREVLRLRPSADRGKRSWREAPRTQSRGTRPDSLGTDGSRGRGSRRARRGAARHIVDTVQAGPSVPRQGPRRQAVSRRAGRAREARRRTSRGRCLGTAYRYRSERPLPRPLQGVPNSSGNAEPRLGIRSWQKLRQRPRGPSSTKPRTSRVRGSGTNRHRTESSGGRDRDRGALHRQARGADWPSRGSRRVR